MVGRRHRHHSKPHTGFARLPSRAARASLAFVIGGKRFGWIERITPAHQLFYKFTVSNGVAINSYAQEMRADVDEINQIVGRSDFDGDLPPPVDGKIHELQPSDTHNDAPVAP